MSFKTKRWAELRTVNMDDLVPGIKAHQEPTAAGIITKGWAVPFGGKIVVMAYAADDTPIYAIYNPNNHSVEQVAESGAGAWAVDSAFHGWGASVKVWRDKYLLICPRTRGYYYASPRFCGFDAGLAFHNPAFQCGDRDRGYMSRGGIGVSGGEPCFISYQYRGSPYYDNYALVKHTLAGTSVVGEGSFYFYYHSGLAWYGMRLFENYWVWRREDGFALYTSPPRSVEDPYLALGSFGTNWTSLDPTVSAVAPHPAGGGTWITADLPGQDQFWAQASSPLTPSDRPWETAWDYRQMQDGGYSLSDHDLDGLYHDVSFPAGPGTGPITRMDNGWYCGLRSIDNPVSFVVYVLDPNQPSKQARTVRKMNLAPACFMGDYAIGDDLKLAHVLPFPDERDPVGTSLPPQDRRDGHIIGQRELFKRVGTKIVYKRDMKLKFDGYGFGDDWWYPGENPDHTLDYTLDFFGGTRTLMGRYPDPMFGRLNPAAQDVSRGMGIPVENLLSREPYPIYTLKDSQVIDGTRSWVSPGATYAIFRGSLFDQRLCYHEVVAPLGSKPQWHARGGLLVGNEWHDLVNFEEIDMPALGNDGWTIAGLCPIPPCRGLKKGGWLVNAELYFAPWETWEWDPGPRDLTFRDTGNGWVPAKYGYIGPLEIEDWHPRLLTAYDEWTKGRSDYGPAALLVFDYDGEFVECLNDETMYPPYVGSEIAVLPGSNPRLLYRVKGGGTYSDCAEGWGCYQNNSGEADFQAPLFAVYELERNGHIQVGAGAFCGFVDMTEMAKYELKAEGWRWSAVGAAVDWQYPKGIWSPYGRVKVREGIGGSGVTPLSPGPYNTNTGKKGVGRIGGGKAF